ncbi:kinase-like protein [Periconia macrospinosa]|uniref:non-specific serine/threonine protein kinase n=1 Tax=Periconia macrospinosa TaxID=97972 RepID=A0A2V1CZK6_9PLEO|nr:kinase-like protein [Periconia macrospinosa]
MDPTRLSLQPPATGTKLRAKQQAQEMQQIVLERARRNREDPPPYEFYELIGRGSFGRVYKGADLETGDTVAIKILDIDSSDYVERSQGQLSTTLKEISTLQQLRDSKARPYVNAIMEALPVHNELWIISEYASGGSVSTLMKPTANKGLDEKFIIPIARELALTLKHTHEIGILHRDLKCANILILEDGRVQLCDFGVSGIIKARQSGPSQRFSVHGTPHWLAPELIPSLINNGFEIEVPYGAEVDIWAYGCTIYEMATGRPPNATTAAHNLPNAPLPTLDGGRYSEDLKNFVAFVFQRNPDERPITDEILGHPFLANSTKLHPTAMLVQLVENYAQWERAGGSRYSLIDPRAGAPAPEALAPEDGDSDEDWTFSTSDEFETRLSCAFPGHFAMSTQNLEGMMGARVDNGDRMAKLIASFKEAEIRRGGQVLGRLFDTNAAPYTFRFGNNGTSRPPSDLILRNNDWPVVPTQEFVIDLDDAAPLTSDRLSLSLHEVPNVKALRNKVIRDAQMGDENSDLFDMDDRIKRVTRFSHNELIYQTTDF